MRKTFLQYQSIFGILSIFVLIGIIAIAILIQPTPTIPIPPISSPTIPIPTIPTPTIPAPTPDKPDPDEAFRNDLSKLLSQIDHQEEVDRNLLTELRSGAYSFEEPLVVVNPYNISPLTALVLFTSSIPLNIGIYVEGEDKLTTIDFLMEGYNTEHIIPIYGLYPDKSNNVILRSKTESGISGQMKLQIQTEPLPEELDNIIILTDLPMREQYYPGLNVVYIDSKISHGGFDAFGKFRWFLTSQYDASSLLSFNDRFFFAQGSRTGKVIFEEINPLGRIYSILYSPYGVHHDIEIFRDNLLVAGSDGATIEDFIYEFDMQTGIITNTLDLKTILQRSRNAYNKASADWFHLNEIAWVEDTGKVIISGRNQSTVAKISWPQGQIDWILAPYTGWLPMFYQHLLDPVGENFEWMYNQHAPQILPDQDNNPDTMDILLFDNGNSRNAPEKYSRMVQYQINESEGTVEQIWQYGKELGSVGYSPVHGNANLLQNGNRLGMFDHQQSKDSSGYYATFFEVTEDSKIVWSAQTISSSEEGFQAGYRITRMDLYNGDANNLQIGTPINNLIPVEILKHYGIE